jgi:Prokaryotic dksA/traR C4-type zinc finger
MLELVQQNAKERSMSTTASVDPGVRPMGVPVACDAAIDRLEQRPIEEVGPPMRWPTRGVSEVPEAAETSTGQPRRDPLSVDQRVARRRDLEGLAALEVNRLERVAAIGSARVAAYDIGIRDAVRDALAKLTDGTYGDCEACRRPIPIARLEEVPYARRCVACQQREEDGWDQVQHLVGGVVRVLAGEPQGRSEMRS